MTTNDSHALLSPSSAYRWLHCTPSAVAEASQPGQTSDFAEEGTLAHALASRELNKFCAVKNDSCLETIDRLRDQYYTQEMDNYVESYVLYVAERLAMTKEHDPGAYLLQEVRLDMSQWAPDAFGTADAVIISNDSIEIIDLKYGKGVRVEAAGNPQLRLYALGVISLWENIYDFKEIRTTIVQPRLSFISEEIRSYEEIKAWGDTYLRPLASVAHNGLGVRAAGEWCRFCKAKGTCGTLAREALYHVDIKASELDDKDIGNLLPKAELAELWARSLKDHALSQALSGHDIEGYKVVKSTQRRQIVNPERVAELMRSTGVRDDDIYRPRELRTLSELEKIAGGKAKFNTLAGDCITLSAAKPTLVPNSDRRPAYNIKDEFKGIIL